jgi:predicted esterase
MSGLDLTLNKTAFFGFENGANLALLTASIASYSVNCTLGLSLLPDFQNYGKFRLEQICYFCSFSSVFQNDVVFKFEGRN